jgi:hypothetical protein
MATIGLTSTNRNVINGAIVLTWEALGNADDGAPFALPFKASITMQAIGTFGSATVALQGSNDGTNWAPLQWKGKTGTALSVTAAGMAEAVECPAFIRPVTTGGTGTEVDVIVAIHAEYSKVGY